MSKILVLSDFPVDHTAELVRNKLLPDHYLWGLNYFQDLGFELEYMPITGGNNIFAKLNTLFYGKKWMPVPFGNLGSQSSVLKHLNGADLIYSLRETECHGLRYLRALKLLKVPIVTLVHHPFHVGRLAFMRKPFQRLAQDGADALLFFSKETYLSAYYKERAHLISWGPDIDFYLKYKSEPTDEIVAAGRAGRDFSIFGQAATKTGIKARIVCSEHFVSDEFEHFGPNVSVQSLEYSYPEMAKIMARASALAIPLTKSPFLAGLTGLCEALGLGKAVIMTRHPLIDLDIEKLGIGKWVEPDDLEGWINVLDWFKRNPEEVYRMGQKARLLAEERLNSKYFAKQVLSIFKQVLNN